MAQVTWTPTARQAEFLSLPDSIFEALYGGAAGGGKTDALLYLPIAREFYKHPKFKGILLRRTFPELESEVILRSQEIYSLCGARYKDQKKRWEWPNGAIMQFGHCEHEKDILKYDTAQYNYIGWDEVTSFTKYQYLYLTMSRCRSATADLPAIVRSGTNPGNISHAFFRERFVEPARKGGVILREKRLLDGKEVVLKRIFIPSLVTDNPHLLAANPDYINKLNSLPTEAERAAKLYGDWWTFSGQVFDEFRVTPLPDEPANAQHVIPEFKIPDYWPRILAIDWGYSAMTCAGFYAINPHPMPERPFKVVKYREYTTKKTKITTWATDLRRISASENLTDVVLDPSAWSSRGDDRTVAEQFTQSFGRAPRKATNDRVAGKLLLQEYLRWSPRPPRYVPQEGYSSEVADRIDRLYGPKALREYESLFRPEEPERFLPAFQIFESCVKTIETIPLCIYDKDHIEDVAEFDGDDPYDETRYGLQACQNYLDFGVPEYEQAARVAKVCSDFERTGNQTQFYINMSNIEARENRAALGVRKFHRNPRLKGCNFR